MTQQQSTKPHVVELTLDGATLRALTPGRIATIATMSAEGVDMDMGYHLASAYNMHDEIVQALRKLVEAGTPTQEGKRDGATMGNLSNAIEYARAILAKVDHNKEQS